MSPELRCEHNSPKENCLRSARHQESALPAVSYTPAGQSLGPIIKRPESTHSMDNNPESGVWDAISVLWHPFPTHALLVGS
jgi:hypothetical protein